MQRIDVLNPKGGSGKTTIAINFVSHFALRGEPPVLMDYDVQGSSSHWVRKRQENQAHVHLISVFEREALATRTFERKRCVRDVVYVDGAVCKADRSGAAANAVSTDAESAK